jgi:hypothetical protein
VEIYKKMVGISLEEIKQRGIAAGGHNCEAGCDDRQNKPLEYVVLDGAEENVKHHGQKPH